MALVDGTRERRGEYRIDGDGRGLTEFLESDPFAMAYLKTLCPDPYYLYYLTVKEMTEKNQQSGIYKSTFSCPGPVPEYPYEKLP